MKLLLIAVHGLNTHWPGPFGNEWVATPRLDAMSAESFVFDHHFCTIPTPAGFRHSWQTGGKPGFDLSKELQERQIHTLYLNNSSEEISGSWSSVVKQPPGESKSIWTLSRLAAKNLSGVNDWFAVVETAQLLPPWSIKPELFANHAKLSELGTESNPLTPIESPQPGEINLNDFEWERLRLSFACAVEEFDRDIALIRASFFPKPDDQAIVIVVGTHGYPLGEHSYVGPHQSTVYAEEVHVPLWIHTPASRSAPRRVVGRLTRHEDLCDTIGEAFGLPVNHSLLRPSELPNRELIVCSRETVSGHAYYMRTNDWSYALPAGTPLEEGKLFSQPDDLWEIMNLAQTQPGTVEDLVEKLKPHSSPEAST